MLTLRRAAERGHFNSGWLDTHHTFSFADYWDPNWMGFRQLRVINEDRIAPGQGFGVHPHRDMEIVTYIISGALVHRDSMGSGSVIGPGDVQRMTAGRGVTHSEFNASDSEVCHLLQIWILPEARGLEPEYDEKHFERDAKLGRLCPIVTSDGRDGSMRIHQHASMFAGILPASGELLHPRAEKMTYWLQLISGELEVEGVALQTGDGLGVNGMQRLVIRAAAEAEFLLFEME